uniref:Tyrosine-protein phosphatase domain-containing protein n=1 Tax=Ditylenchus dipsaci TaxID=166011 RepID=A0A915DJU9_9BILA
MILEMTWKEKVIDRRNLDKKTEMELWQRKIGCNGGGRSGAFLALDANLELLEKTGQVDVYEYAKTLVNSRQHLIESVDQYTFIYDILCEAIMCNIEPIEMHRLKERSTMYKSKKDRELMEMQITQENKLLLMLTSTLRIGDCAGGHRLENRGKNRDVMVCHVSCLSKSDHARPYLQTLHGESKDYTYINAVEVDGFTRKSEFIVTEWPKQQTLDSFWTLVFDHSVHTVINLTNPSNNKIYPPFIHSKGKKNYGPFMVEIVNCQQYPGLTSYMAKITKRTMEDMQKRKPSAMEHCFKKKHRQLTPCATSWPSVLDGTPVCPCCPEKTRRPPAGQPEL